MYKLIWEYFKSEFKQTAVLVHTVSAIHQFQVDECIRRFVFPLKFIAFY